MKWEETQKENIGSEENTGIQSRNAEIKENETKTELERARQRRFSMCKIEFPSKKKSQNCE